MHPSFRISVLILVLFTLDISVVSADAVHPHWTLVEVSGAVEFTDSAKHKLVAQAGTMFEPPFAIATSDNGHAVVAHGQDRLTVSADSRIDIPQPATVGTGIFTRISQRLGSVLFQVEHRIQDSFEVDTPYLVSVVKGTTFNIHATPDDSTVTLIEGKLWVHTPDLKSEVILKPGQAAIKSRNGKGILVKDQQALSSLRRGPITVANGTGLPEDRDTGQTPTDGALPRMNTISPNVDQSALRGGYSLPQTANPSISSTSAVASGQSALSIDGGVGSVALSSKVSASDLLDATASLGGVSTTATVGVGSVLSVDASVGKASTSVSVDGVVNLGIAVGGTSTNPSVGSLIDLGSTTTGGSTTAAVTTTSTPATTSTTTPTSTSPSLTQVPIVGSVLGSVLKFGK